MNSRKKFLAASEASMTKFCPTPGFMGRTFKLWVLSTWIFSSSIGSTMLQGQQDKEQQKCSNTEVFKQKCSNTEWVTFCTLYHIRHTYISLTLRKKKEKNIYMLIIIFPGKSQRHPVPNDTRQQQNMTLWVSYNNNTNQRLKRANHSTCGTSSHFSAASSASLALALAFLGSQSSQSGHSPDTQSIAAITVLTHKALPQSRSWHTKHCRNHGPDTQSIAAITVLTHKASLQSQSWHTKHCHNHSPDTQNIATITVPTHKTLPQSQSWHTKHCHNHSPDTQNIATITVLTHKHP